MKFNIVGKVASDITLQLVLQQFNLISQESTNFLLHLIIVFTILGELGLYPWLQGMSSTTKLFQCHLVLNEQTIFDVLFPPISYL